jgi:type III secretion protein R
MQNLNPFWLIFATSCLALLPIAISLVTSYVKVSVVLSMVRNALGTQQVPGTLVIMALSLALTCFIMGPVLEQSWERAKQIDFEKITNSTPSIQRLQGIGEVFVPWREFLEKHSGPRELAALLALDQGGGAKVISSSESMRSQQPPLRVVLPAFVISELKEAFTMGFLVLLPFLLIDLIVANILAGLGMFMMSPAMISLPIKILLFVMSDAWLVIIRGLVLSYR